MQVHTRQFFSKSSTTSTIFKVKHSNRVHRKLIHRYLANGDRYTANIAIDKHRKLIHRYLANGDRYAANIAIDKHGKLIHRYLANGDRYEANIAIDKHRMSRVALRLACLHFNLGPLTLPLQSNIKSHRLSVRMLF